MICATADRVVADITEFPEFTENAVTALRDRYLIKEHFTDEKGVQRSRVIETPDELMWRVADCLAQPERKYGAGAEQVEERKREFFGLLRSFRFMVNSPTLMNANRPMSMLSACFVIPLHDSIESIMECAKTTAFVQKAGGGCGYALDGLRPCGSFISSSGGTTSGPLSFWRMMSEVTQSIQQGSFRRGANMAMMDVSFPDIIKFIFAKQNLALFTNYNISIKVSDDFMRAVTEAPESIHKVFDFRTKTWYAIPTSVVDTCRNAVDFSLTDPLRLRAIDNCYGIQDLEPADRKATRPCLTNGEIWSMITNHAHATGEPGICFIDRIRETEPTPHIGLIQTTNPCGEAALLPGESCNLGSINLAQFIKVCFMTPSQLVNAEIPWTGEVDWDGLRDAVRIAVRMLDNVIDANKFPTDEITKMVNGNRKIGLGVMGLADALFMLGARYDSANGINAVGTLLEFVNNAAMEADKELAEERGVFPNWPGSRWEGKGIKLRNADVTSIAPTGTISIISNCSCGIEPLFSLSFRRNVLDGKKLYQGHDFFEKVAKHAGFWRDDLLDEAATHGSIQHLDYIPQRIRNVFRCAHDITPEFHVRMQAEAQKHTTNSVSKTINLPSSATVEDVSASFLLAWKLQCKAVTVYRDGCRLSQPMQLLNAVEKVIPQVAVETIPAVGASSTPEICPSVRVRIKTAFGSLHMTIVEHPSTKQPIECFAHCGSNGGVEQADLEAICRLSSIALQAGVPLSILIDQLSRPGTSISSKEGINSLPQALATGLLRYYEEAAARPNVDQLLILSELKRDSLNGNGHGPSIKAMNNRLHSSPAGYRIVCPKGDGNCNGMVHRNGNCASCTACGASTCA